MVRNKEPFGFLRNVGIVLALSFLVFVTSFLLKSRWSSEFNYLVVVASESRLGLLVVNPVSESALVISIPENMMMPVVGMKGEIRSAGVWKFGVGEERPVEITKRTVETFLGIKVDSLIYDRDWDGTSTS